jgi:hypothetical protein
MHRYLLLLPLLGGLLVCTAPTRAQQAAHPAPAYRLNRLAANIADGPAMLRADLARIAIDELAMAYADEAARARRDKRRRAQQSDLWRWAAAVEGLAAEYSALAATITFDTPVEINVGPDDDLHLVVAGRSVVVGNPRMREQAAFEQRVIARFCELNLCRDLLDEPDLPVTATAAARRHAEPQWSFSQQAGPVCSTDDGLEFQFRNMEDIGRKREACARVAAELNTLAMAIAQDVAGGIRVDWNRLVIQHLPDGDEQVILNGEGDYLRLSLPLLVARQELINVVRPWLAAKVSGQRYTLVVLNAGRLLAPPGRPME